MTTSSNAQLTYRPADARGKTEIGWLKSRHSFSFGQYHDPTNTHFSELRVINDDWVAPNQGFGEHPHRDMEILTWVLQGTLRHGDSLGNMRNLTPGELQAMSAGTGIRHSEINPSADEPVHLLQIWIMPDREGITPRYDQKTFPPAQRAGRWDTLAAGPNHQPSAPAAMPVHQDLALYVVDLSPGQSVPVTLPQGRQGYLHLATGQATLGQQAMTEGDAVTFQGQASLTLRSDTGGQALYFDLP